MTKLLEGRAVSYVDMETVYGNDNIDAMMHRTPGDKAADERPWENYTLGQSEDVTQWVKEPSVIQKVQPNLRRMADLIGTSERKTVLDIGCYGGYAYGFLRRAGCDISYLGVDVNYDVVKEARTLHARDENALFERADLFDLGQIIRAYGTFDYALCLRVLIHLPNVETAINSITGAAKTTLLGIKLGSDKATRRMDMVSGEHHYYRHISKKTVMGSTPPFSSAVFYDDHPYQSVVIAR